MEIKPLSAVATTSGLKNLVLFSIFLLFLLQVKNREAIANACWSGVGGRGQALHGVNDKENLRMFNMSSHVTLTSFSKFTY